MIVGDFLLSLDRVVKVGKLFSFYGSLLTDRQQEFVKLYYHHDLSLGEIASEQEISRQAVYDNLKRSEEALKDYEEKLGFAKEYDKIESQLDRLEGIIDGLNSKLEEDDLESLNDILKKLKSYQEGELL